jgi:hypothetical protein
MANPNSNPTQRNEPAGGTRVGVKRKVGGSQRRTAPPPTVPGTRGRAVTTSGGGGTGGTPGSRREAQDAANGTVHGQPRSGYRNQGIIVDPIDGEADGGGSTYGS